VGKRGVARGRRSGQQAERADDTRGFQFFNNHSCYISMLQEAIKGFFSTASVICWKCFR